MPYHLLVGLVNGAEEGIVPGGGTGLVYASRTLDSIKAKCENFDQTVGVGIIKKAIRMPAKTIADNAGERCTLVPCCTLSCGS